MKKFLLYIIGFVLVISCNFGDSVTIKGELQGFDEGELYFYRPFDNSHVIDTVKVKRGRFIYETSVEKEMPVILQFSSAAEIPVFVKGGLSVSIKGNVTDLQNIKVKGGDANKEMSEVRTDINRTPGKPFPIIDQFIKKHPESIVSTYLFYKYYIQAQPVNFGQIKRILSELRKGQPQDVYLKQTEEQLKEYLSGMPGKDMPAFQLETTNKKTITNKQYKGKYYLVLIGASWAPNSSSYLYSLAATLSDKGKKIAIIYVSLDVSSNMTPSPIQNLNITYVNEPLVWESMFVKNCHILNVPDNILVAPNGKIAVRSLSTDRLAQTINALPL